MCERVARIGIDGAQRRLAGRQVIRVTRVDALVVALWRRAHDPLRLHRADHARELAAQIERRLEATVWVAEEDEIGDADVLGCFGLLDSAKLGHVWSGHIAVVTTRVAV